MEIDTWKKRKKRKMEKNKHGENGKAENNGRKNGK